MEMTRPAGELATVLRRVLAGEVPKVHHLQGILDAHGWPDVEEVERNAAALEKVAGYDVTFEIDEWSRPRYRCHCHRLFITPESLSQHRRKVHTSPVRSMT